MSEVGGAVGFASGIWAFETLPQAVSALLCGCSGFELP